MKSLKLLIFAALVSTFFIIGCSHILEDDDDNGGSLSGLTVASVKVSNVKIVGAELKGVDTCVRCHTNEDELQYFATTDTTTSYGGGG